MPCAREVYSEILTNCSCFALADSFGELYRRIVHCDMADSVLKRKREADDALHSRVATDSSAPTTPVPVARSMTPDVLSSKTNDQSKAVVATDKLLGLKWLVVDESVVEWISNDAMENLYEYFENKF